MKEMGNSFIERILNYKTSEKNVLKDIIELSVGRPQKRKTITRKTGICVLELLSRHIYQRIFYSNLHMASI